MIQIKKMAAGISFDVRVKTQAGKTAVVGKYGGRMKITVKSPPEKGRANEEVVECISDFLNIPKSQFKTKTLVHYKLRYIKFSTLTGIINFDQH